MRGRYFFLLAFTFSEREILPLELAATSSERECF
jgi:hypothetical protein